MNLKDLKARSQDMSATLEAAKKLNAKTEFEDNDSTFWSPSRDKKTGNGFARVRLLGPPKIDVDVYGNDAVPFVKYYRHSFQNPLTGEWYIENCLTTDTRLTYELGKKDPVNDLTRILYKSGTEHDKGLAGKYKRKATYVANVLVIDDQQEPSNNGFVKKYRFGVKIWEKIEAAMAPKIGKAIDPFNFWTGADFGIVTKTVSEFANYDDSAFDTPGPVGDDDFIEKLWNESYSLKAFLDEKNFKDYDTLKAKLDSVLGFSYAERGSAANAGAPASAPVLRQVTPVASAPVATTPPWEPSEPVRTPSVAAPIPAGDEEDMAFLKGLAAKK